MYDSLEGLDYKPGELSVYVGEILKDVNKSKEKGDLQYIPANEVKTGDVCVRPYSSHLVLDDGFEKWSYTRRNGKFEEILVIREATLKKLREEKHI